MEMIRGPIYLGKQSGLIDTEAMGLLTNPLHIAGVNGGAKIKQ
jgi:hypothetical protein